MDPGIDNQDIQSAKCFDRRDHHPLDLIDLGHVDLYGQPTSFSDFSSFISTSKSAPATL